MVCAMQKQKGHKQQIHVCIKILLRFQQLSIKDIAGEEKYLIESNNKSLIVNLIAATLSSWYNALELWQEKNY